MFDTTPYSRDRWKLRMLDIVLAVPALLLLAPVMVLIALAVRLDSRGPVIYREARLGRGGRPFTIHKFRTLHPGHSEESLVALPGDPRITRLGRRLRPAHVDELPQLFDVLRGRMSLVGPRPARAEIWAGVPADLRARALSFRPGMTSPASVAFLCENRFLSRCPEPEALYRDIVFPEKVAEDVRYFESRTFGSDFRLLLRTLLRVELRRRDEQCRKRLEHLLGIPDADIGGNQQ
jgi:lipopolysaccharide/colanic/teichoic acid biosynthesis glycosyltransferase